jgi:tRNA (mo5U34)-methyltransferase
MATRESTLRQDIDSARWYHAMELPGGIVTPGDYDLPDTVKRIPFPASLEGKRCLDVGTRDGFWAFEMERRGAAEVVAIDLPSQADVDFPQPRPKLDEETVAGLEQRQSTFEIAHRALGSKVQWTPINVYDLSAEAVGEFDFAFVGTLLLHLRNPVDAMTAIRSVLKPDATFQSNNPVSIPLSIVRPRQPTAEIMMWPNRPYFYVPNVAGHVRMVEGAGFEVTDATRPYLMRYGAGWQRPPLKLRPKDQGPILQQLVLRRGAPHTCVTATPRFN